VSIAALLTAAGLLWGAVREADLERELEEAVHREIVLGDLGGAMQQYRDILAESGKVRPVAARALLQIGSCLEKLGQGKEAYNTYRKVLNDYHDQAAIVVLANRRLEAWIGPRNLKFDEGVPLQAPPGWKEANNLAELRHKDCRSDVGCVTLVAPVNVPGPGNLMQSFNATAYRGKTVRLRAWLRLEKWFGMPIGRFIMPTPEDRGQLWLRVVRANRRFTDMQDQPVRDSNWVSSEIVAEIDEDAQGINFGVMSFGSGGRVWVDDVSFEVIPKK
jgi:hypothetical protein